mgnify:CR=1 FL=1
MLQTILLVAMILISVALAGVILIQRSEGGALGIMTSYNRLNGEYCADSRWLLADVLRGEWGFDGFVIVVGRGEVTDFASIPRICWPMWITAGRSPRLSGPARWWARSSTPRKARRRGCG